LGCLAGTYSSSAQSTTCFACQKGYYQPSANATSALPCPDSYFSPVEGATTCSACAEGSYIPLNSTASSCIACPDGTYLSLASSSCISCPVSEGIYCTGGRVRALNGYFVAYDPDTNVASSTSCASNRCVPCSSNSTSDLICCAADRLPAALNPLCGKCIDGLVDIDGECIGKLSLLLPLNSCSLVILVVCNESNFGYILLMLLGCWASMILFHAITQSPSAINRQFFFFVQTVYLFITLDINWLNFLSIFEFNLFSGSTFFFFHLLFRFF
jgi:hypothetical protein